MGRGTARKSKKVSRDRRRRVQGSIATKFCKRLAKDKAVNVWSIDTVSKKIGISSRHLYRLLNNEVSPTLEISVKLCRLLGIRLEAIV